jgi:serine/threonine-protein kinase RsbW
MATVEVAFTPLPAHVRTARLVATAVARRSGVDEELLDEVRLAVGEACSRAVEAHRRHCPAEPVRIEMTDLGERFEVIVRDAVPSAAPVDASVNGAEGVASLAAGAGGARLGSAPAGAISAAAGKGESPASASAGAGETAVSAGAGPVSAGGADQDGTSTGIAGVSNGLASFAGPANTADPANTIFGLAVISGLADDVRISATGSGVSVRMTWPAAPGAEV